MQELFDDVLDLSPERVQIDDAPVTEDNFIDDNLFRDTDIKDKDKENIDDILQKLIMAICVLLKRLSKLKKR